MYSPRGIDYVFIFIIPLLAFGAMITCGGAAFGAVDAAAPAPEMEVMEGPFGPRLPLIELVHFGPKTFEVGVYLEEAPGPGAPVFPRQQEEPEAEPEPWAWFRPGLNRETERILRQLAPLSERTLSQEPARALPR